MRAQFEAIKAEAEALQKENNSRIASYQAGTLGKKVAFDLAVFVQIQINAFIDWTFEDHEEAWDNGDEAKATFFLYLQKRYKDWLDNAESQVRMAILTEGINGVDPNRN